MIIPIGALQCSRDSYSGRGHLTNSMYKNVSKTYQELSHAKLKCTKQIGKEVGIALWGSSFLKMHCPDIICIYRIQARLQTKIKPQC